MDFTLPTRIHLTTYPFEHVDIVKLISYFQAKIDVNCELSFDRLGSSTNRFMYLQSYLSQHYTCPKYVIQIRK